MRILFYDDAPDFGGHELQTLAAVRHIAAQPHTEVGFIYFRGNARLSKLIAEVAAQSPSFKAMPQDYASGKFQVFRTLVSRRAIQQISAEMATYAPDLVVIAQGAIAYCSAGLLAAKKVGLPTLSYIPMTHPERLFSASRIRAALREPVNHFYYRQPDGYITIGARMEAYLRQRGLRQPVTVVQPAVELSDFHLVDKLVARASLGFAASDKVVALIGRVQFWQKRQDLAVEALALARQKNPDLKLLIVGDGPDLDALKALVRLRGLQDAVVFAGWTDGLSAVYCAVDALVIPSRYEGLPLVMLQALYFRLPVIASDVDGMADLLPPHWLFPSGDASAFADRLVQAISTTNDSLLVAHSDKVVKEFSLPVFEQAFMAAIASAVNRPRPGRAAQ
jgi:glycosyltransferase involved in cell wall biosynthesis